jgi:hypothetical protein
MRVEGEATSLQAADELLKRAEDANAADLPLELLQQVAAEKTRRYNEQLKEQAKKKKQGYLTSVKGGNNQSTQRVVLKPFQAVDKGDFTLMMHSTHVPLKERMVEMANAKVAHDVTGFKKQYFSGLQRQRISASKIITNRKNRPALNFVRK